MIAPVFWGNFMTNEVRKNFFRRRSYRPNIVSSTKNSRVNDEVYDQKELADNSFKESNILKTFNPKFRKLRRASYGPARNKF